MAGLPDSIAHSNVYFNDVPCSWAIYWIVYYSIQMNVLHTVNSWYWLWSRVIESINHSHKSASFIFFISRSVFRIFRKFCTKIRRFWNSFWRILNRKSFFPENCELVICATSIAQHHFFNKWTTLNSVFKWVSNNNFFNIDYDVTIWIQI